MMTNPLCNIKEKVREAIVHAIVSAKLVTQEQIPIISLEVPRDKAHGDLSTNIAMRLARLTSTNPRQVAQVIVSSIHFVQSQISSVDIAGPGFINFTFDKSYLYPVLSLIRQQGPDYGRTKAGQGEKVQIEFVSANPTGSLHLGHARCAAVGDALANILDFAGYEVTREYYINDAGNQVLQLCKSIEARYLQKLGQRVDMPVDGYYGDDIITIAEQLVREEGNRLLSLDATEREAYFRAYGLKKQLHKIEQDLALFRVNFDHWFSETSLYSSGAIQNVLEQLAQAGETYREEGAIWLKTTKYGDSKDRVLVKQDGTYTYLTPDIAYHLYKYSRKYDKIINLWGADHHGYIARMKAAMEALGHDSSRLVVLIGQMVSLFQNGNKIKMSKRTGKSITLEDLMDEVGVDAIRYFFTMRSMDSHLDFDMDLALSASNENPVFYVQYAHARICSVFRQMEQLGIALLPLSESILCKLTCEQEFDLLHKIAEFPQEVDAAAEDYAVHRIVRYVHELATLFHSYYRAERVITEDMMKTQARIALIGAVRTVIATALKLIGVSAPQKM